MLGLGPTKLKNEYKASVYEDASSRKTPSVVEIDPAGRRRAVKEQSSARPPLRQFGLTDSDGSGSDDASREPRTVLGRLGASFRARQRAPANPLSLSHSLRGS